MGVGRVFENADWLHIVKVAGKVAAVVILLVLTFVFLHRVRTVLPPFVIAVVISYILNPAVNYGQRRGLTRAQAIAVTYLVLVVVATVVLVFVIPVLVNEVNRLTDNIPQYISQMQQGIGHLERLYEAADIPTAVRDTVNQTVEHFLLTLEERLTGVLSGIMVGVGGFFSSLFYLLLGNLLAIYVLKDSREMYRSFEQLFPAPYRPAVLRFLTDVNRVISGFVHGRLIISAGVGVLATVVLAIFGIRFYLMLGIIAGLTNLIPYFGPFIGAVPAVLLASFQSVGLVVQVAILYVLIQQFDGFILSPRIMARTTGLHPLGVVFAVLAFGSLFGWWGLFFGVPLGATVKVCFDHLLRWVRAA